MHAEHSREHDPSARHCHRLARALAGRATPADAVRHRSYGQERHWRRYFGCPGNPDHGVVRRPNGSRPYTVALRIPAHTKIAAHTHRDNRVAVVILGVWFFGYGSSADETEVKALELGSFYTEPADAPHFALTQDEPTTVYITGFGPTDTHYIDATTDPRQP